MKRSQHFPSLSPVVSIIILIILSCANNSVRAMDVPVEYYKLKNGLKVVLSQDKTAPIIAVGVYYNIGFRTEPKNRTGFAHLFEHMMFQGSKNLGKMEYISLVEKNGGILNGSTRFDFTNYYAVVPSNQLQPLLWAEADRMKSLKVTPENLLNQQGVVKNEVKVNVLNQPYGGFPWLDMPQLANENWFNAHNFYGDLADLDSANMQDVNGFFKTYYSPNNAVLVLTGDFQTGEAKQWIKQYFDDIPTAQQPPAPDLTEPVQQKEKRRVKEDSLANKPAMAIAYKMPPQYSPEYFAMGLLDQILVKGNNSKLYQRLVQEKGYTSSVDGGINHILGNMFDYNGPMLWMVHLIYDTTVNADEVLQEVDKVVEEVINSIKQDDLDLAIVKQRSWLYDELGGYFGIGKLNLLACFALFNDDPSKINSIEASFKKVTPALIRQTAKEYLRTSNRSILIIEPKSPTL